MSSLSLFESNLLVSDFFSKFSSIDPKKLTKYLITIAIDYLGKYYKTKPIQFENIRDLAKMIKSKHLAKMTAANLVDTTLHNELKEIHTELSKLKSFCSNEKPKKPSVRSSSLEEKKSLTIEELSCNSAEKQNKKKRDITPKITESMAPNYSSHSKSVGKPPLTKHHLDDNEIKASLLEISSNLFASCNAAPRKIEFPMPSYNSAKNQDSNGKKLFSASQSKTSTRDSKPIKNRKINQKKNAKNSQNAEKIIKIPNYLKNVKSRIKPEVEFHKRLFRESQRSPDFQMKEELNVDDNRHMINEFITFGSAYENPSPINEEHEKTMNNLSELNISENFNNFDKKGSYNDFSQKFKKNNNSYFSNFMPKNKMNDSNFNNNNNNNNLSENNSNIMEIANSFLKSPFMHFVQNSNGNNNNNNNYGENDTSRISKVLKKSKSPYCTQNGSEMVFNDVTQRSNREAKKDVSGFSNLIKIEQTSEADSISSTFSMLPTNEELQGFFKREFCFNLSKDSKNSTERHENNRREHGIGKIVSLRKDKENCNPGVDRV